MAYFDYRVRDELNFRIGRFSPSFGAFNVRHDPANHATSSKPLPYDMGRMLRMTEWNLGVIPSPFPDNGIEIGGTHWFGERAADGLCRRTPCPVSRPTRGRRTSSGRTRRRRRRPLVDNNGRPAVGARWALTLKLGEANDLTGGASIMYGTYDPANRYAYMIAGVDLAARLGRTQIRFEYLVRRQAFEADPTMSYRTPVALGEHPGLRQARRLSGDRAGDERRADAGDARRRPVSRRQRADDAARSTRAAAIFRYTGGATLAVIPGWRVKASAELWAFTNDPPIQQELELALHLALVGTF